MLRVLVVLLLALAGCGGGEPDARAVPSDAVGTEPAPEPTPAAALATGKPSATGALLKVCVRRVNAPLEDAVSVAGPTDRAAKLAGGSGAQACTPEWRVPAGLYRVNLTRDDFDCLNDRLTVYRDGRQVFAGGGEPGGADRFLPYEAQVGSGQAVGIDVSTSCAP